MNNPIPKRAREIFERVAILNKKIQEAKEHGEEYVMTREERETMDQYCNRDRVRALLNGE